MGVMSGGALVVVLVLVVVLCVKRSRRKLVRQEGITNVLYGGEYMENSCVSIQTRYLFSCHAFTAGGSCNNDHTIVLKAGDKDVYYTPVNAIPTNTLIPDLKVYTGIHVVSIVWIY